MNLYPWVHTRECINSLLHRTRTLKGTNCGQLNSTQLKWETVGYCYIIGLSKERPILDHHAKAHIHEIRQISYRFHEISQISPEIHMKSARFQVKSGGFHTDFMKSAGFRTDFTHEIRRISHMISKDQLPGMVSLMFAKLLPSTTQKLKTSVPQLRNNLKKKPLKQYSH